MSFHPYLFFSGDCADAFARYHEIFGGDLQVLTMADVPEGVEPMEGAEPHHVMHAAITIGDSLLMGSDDPTGDGGPKVGSAVTYSTVDKQDAARVFDELVVGGDVTLPLTETFFSPGFGMCTDRFGVPWMVVTDQES